MASAKQCVTSSVRIPTARAVPWSASGARPKRRARVIPALALVCASALCVPAVLAQSSPVLSGKWQLSCTGRGGEVRQISLDIAQEGSALSGSYTGGSRSGQLNGSVQGNQVSIALAGRRRSVTFTGTADGNTLQVHTAKGVACTGTRQ